MEIQQFTIGIFDNIGNYIYFYFQLFYSSMTYHSKTVYEDLARLSLINNLKLRIQDLKQEVQKQRRVIEGYKKSTQITLLNEQQIQIQKLNDENKRLLLIIEQMKFENTIPMRKVKGTKIPRHSNHVNNLTNKKKSQDQEKQQQNEKKEKKEGKEGKGKQKKINFEEKYYQVLMENEKMRKQLVFYRASENVLKPKKSNGIASIMMEKTITQTDKIKQKNYELEVQLTESQQKASNLKVKVTELENMLEKVMEMNSG